MVDSAMGGALPPLEPFDERPLLGTRHQRLNGNNWKRLLPFGLYVGSEFGGEILRRTVLA
jgi:hypothetical protein